jgi:hypothetical protein
MRGPSAAELANRDPALSAIYGFAALKQADFGIEGNLTDAAASNQLAAYDLGQGHYDSAFNLDRDAADLRRDNAQLTYEQRLAAHLREQRDDTEARLRLLYPNGRSLEKIERYTFSVEQEIVLGAPEGLAMTNSPLTDIKPDRLIFNAPCYNFALINTVQIGNTSVIIGGSEDAFNYTNVAVQVTLGMPMLKTSSRALVGGQYGGLAPAPFTAGNEYNFVATFHGWARMFA